MKRIAWLLFLPAVLLPAYGQDEGKTVALDEVVVGGKRVVNKVDGCTVYPAEAQKAASTGGYSLLAKLALPGIRVDEVAHTVTAPANRGDVQVRINGIVVDKADMLALDPRLVTKVDFIDQPGVRYGEGVAYVLNIFTRRADRGYTVGMDAKSALTAWQGNATAYGKWHAGRSELSFTYDFSGYKLRGVRNEETADYTLSDGSVHRIGRQDRRTLQAGRSHDLKLTYNLADTAVCSYVFQASLCGAFSRTPGDYSLREILDGGHSYAATDSARSRSASPVLDLYFFRQFTSRQSLTANVVGTYIATDQAESYDEGSPYRREVDGRTASVLSEIIYENRLKPFTLSVGLNYSGKYTENDYTGDTEALTILRRHYLYAFGEVKGAVGPVRYSAGMGTGCSAYRQGGHRYRRGIFRPKATVAYHFTDGCSLSYSWQMQDRLSRIAMVSDAVVRTNSMEYTVGNPDLKPSRDTEHTLRLSYSGDRLEAFAECFYKHCHRPNMALYERTPDDQFLYTQVNQKAINLLRPSLYAGYWLLPGKLQVMLYGGLQRCFNYGFSYTHCYTSWFCTGSLSAYLGEFTLQAYADNGSRWFEGEARGFSGSYAVLQAAYKYRDWHFSLSWQNPFCGNYRSFESEVLHKDLHKLHTTYDADGGNRLTLGVTWRMSRGRKYKSAEKTLHHRDTDNGIL